MEEVKNIKPTTNSELKVLIPKIRKGDKAALKRVVEGNLKLVINVAKHYTGYGGLEFLDLIEEGNVGLIKAIEKYNPRMGYSFSTYAFWWIRQYIQRAILNQTKTIRIPFYVYEVVKKLLKVSEELHQKLDRQPTTPELARQLHLSIQKTRKFMQEIQMFQKVGSLESPLNDKMDVFLKDLIRDKETHSPDYIVDLIKSHEELEKLLKSLTRQEKKIIRLRFGLVDGKGYNLREIGQRMGLSRERIRQLETRALSKLKNLITRMNLP